MCDTEKLIQKLVEMSSAKGNRSRRVGETSRGQSTIDQLINVVPQLLEREAKRDEHAAGNAKCREY